MTDVITKIKSDLDNDMVMIAQLEEEMRAIFVYRFIHFGSYTAQLEEEMRAIQTKIEYYKGKFDGRNEAFEAIKAART